ncbi:hypothetical protein [Rathayibacter festucae]|nr:hypothetical protein [Rathayibacter festucae]QHC61590.1 hypothetical protein GSU69_01980 [Rathayibacter festucae]
MKLWKTMAICSTTLALVGLSAVSPAMATTEETPAAGAAVAPSPEWGPSGSGPRAAQPLSLPGRAPVEDGAVDHRAADESAPSSSKHLLTFANDGAPGAVRVEVRYRQGNGDLFKEVSPLLPPGPSSWTTSIQGDARDLFIEVHDASGALLEQWGFLGELPSGDPSVYWSTQILSGEILGYTVIWS